MLTMSRLPCLPLPLGISRLHSRRSSKFCVYTYIYIYIHIYRERERCVYAFNNTYINIYTHINTCMCVYIYIYVFMDGRRPCLQKKLAVNMAATARLTSGRVTKWVPGNGISHANSSSYTSTSEMKCRTTYNGVFTWVNKK